MPRIHNQINIKGCRAFTIKLTEIKINRRDNSEHAPFMLIVQSNFIWIGDNYYSSVMYFLFLSFFLLKDIENAERGN